MSVMLIDETEVHKSWPCYCPDCPEMPDHERQQLSDLMSVISGQHELTQLVFNGWWTICCIDCGEVEVSDKSIETFARELKGLGWAADSVKRSTAICKKCANQPDTSTYASQFEDNRGLLG